MENEIKRVLEPTDYLRKNIRYFIEAFVSYYGEEDREFIERKIANTHLMMYQTNDDLQYRLDSLTEKYGDSFYEDEKYKKYFEYAQKNKILNSELQAKYEREFAKRIIHYFPDNVQRLLKKYVESNMSLLKFIIANNCIELETLIGYLDQISIYEYFTPEMEEKLKNPQLSIFERNTILKNRKNYLNAIGIYRGRELSNYKGFEKYYPTQEMVSEILKAKEELYNAYISEYSLNKYPNNVYIEESNKLGLMIDNRLSIAQAEFREEATCLIPNYRIMNDKIELFPEMLMYIGIDHAERDASIIHELNHVLELHIQNIKNNNIETISGWDQFSINIEDANYIKMANQKSLRKYERFSEVINDLLALEISDILKQTKGSLFSIQNDDYKIESDYLNQEYIVKDFFETYKKEIISSRRNGNINIIFDAVGKENFDALNEIVKEDNETFSWTERLVLKEHIKNNVDSTLVNKYNDFINRRDAILEKMNTHYQKNLVSQKGKQK